LDRKAATVNFALEKSIGCRLRVRSVTIDNDACFRRHPQTSRILHAPIFSCHPYRSREEGQAERTSRMIRRFVPKGTSIAEVPERKIARIQEVLDGRPYKCLGFCAPAEVAAEHPKLKKFAARARQTFQRSEQFAMIF
jgi:IS30 family transposase